jgi:hypothetical protein
MDSATPSGRKSGARKSPTYRIDGYPMLLITAFWTSEAVASDY